MSNILVVCGNKSGAITHYLPALRLGGWQEDIYLAAPGDILPPLKTFSGLMLCGGMDINPHLWDLTELLDPTTEVDEARDAFEGPIVRQAWELRLPILGICRGEQMLNVALGGSLFQDIPRYFDCEPLRHRHSSSDIPKVHHDVQLNPRSLLATIVGSTGIHVNSRHHQAVKRLASGLKAVAWHLDTKSTECQYPGPLIEAIEAEDASHWALGIQWHPEDLVGLEDETGAAARKIFESFAKAAGR